MNQQSLRLKRETVAGLICFDLKIARKSEDV